MKGLIYYQLVAKGRYALFEEKTKIHSKAIFTSPDLAEGYIPEFKKKVSTPLDAKDIFFLDTNKPIEIKIVPLEVYK